MRTLLTIKWTKAGVFVLCLIPLDALVWRGFHNGLGANPVEFIQLTTGDWTLRFLVFTLCITPFRKLLNLPDLIRFRRMLGLFAFSYVCLHFDSLLLEGEVRCAHAAFLWRARRHPAFLETGRLVFQAPFGGRREAFAPARPRESHAVVALSRFSRREFLVAARPNH